MNIGALALMPLAPERDHVAHLMDEQQGDEAGGERPSPQQRVGGERDEDRAGRGEQLELGEQQQDRLELRQQRDDRRAERRSRRRLIQDCVARRRLAGRRVRQRR